MSENNKKPEHDNQAEKSGEETRQSETHVQNGYTITSCYCMTGPKGISGACNFCRAMYGL